MRLFYNLVYIQGKVVLKIEHAPSLENQEISLNQIIKIT